MILMACSSSCSAIAVLWITAREKRHLIQRDSFAISFPPWSQVALMICCRVAMVAGGNRSQMKQSQDLWGIRVLTIGRGFGSQYNTGKVGKQCCVAM